MKNNPRAGRWAYMGRPGFNPPNDACPECTAPSKTYMLGSKRSPDDPNTTVTRWTCEYGHTWTTTTTRETP